MQTPTKPIEIIPSLEKKEKHNALSNKRGFLVVSIENATETLPLLALAEDKHFHILRIGPHTNKVALGIYNGKGYAMLRQNKMLLNGIGTIIVNRGDGVTERTVSIPQNTIRAYKEENFLVSSLEGSLVSEGVHIAALTPENLAAKNDIDLSHNLDRVIQLISSQ